MVEPTPAFPHGLRIEAKTERLEAAGRRAWLGESEDRSALRVVLDGIATVIAIDPPLADGAVDGWPFAAMRAQTTPRQLAFASADQPVAALELVGLLQPMRLRIAAGYLRIAANDARLTGDWMQVQPDANGRVRIVMHRADVAEPDVSALLGSSIARARRRVAERPRIALPEGGSDVIAALERDLWLETSSNEALDTPVRVAASLALLALNDTRGALDVLRAAERQIASDPALATIVAGAWIAWRGVALPLDLLRRTVTESPRDPSSMRDDVIGRSAFAMRPFVSNQPLHEHEDSKARDPSSGFREIARLPGVPRACATVLELVHGRLGVVPDAERARVRLGPDLATGRSTVEQLALGDATLEMVADVGGESATIEVEQTSGGTPLTGILEPRIAARRLRNALVEATPADLESSAEDGGLRVRVQLVIDRRRSLVLNFERR